MPGDYKLLVKELERIQKEIKDSGGNPLDFNYFSFNIEGPGEKLDEFIKKYVRDILNKDKSADIPCEYIETDNFAEILEKLCILHIRTWYLENQVINCKNNEELGILKSKVDQCFKVRRPKFIAALNKLIDLAILDGKSLKEDSVKLYEGFK